MATANDETVEPGMKLLASLEKHPFLWLASLVGAAFLAGAAAVIYIHAKVTQEVDRQLAGGIQERVRAEVSTQVSEYLRQQSFAALPADSVVAFNLAKCPTGWEEFALARGRTIVGTGVGNRDMNDVPLTPRSLGEISGEEKHKLTVAELPTHDHQVHVRAGYPGGDGLGATYGSGEPRVHNVTGPRGDGQPHNNMPPFVVLRFCYRLK